MNRRAEAAVLLGLVSLPGVYALLRVGALIGGNAGDPTVFVPSAPIALFWRAALAAWGSAAVGGLAWVLSAPDGRAVLNVSRWALPASLALLVAQAAWFP